MTDASQPVDFDTRPPMPVSEYEATVKRANVGYDLVFTLALCFLRALRRPALELLVVGAGGGAEIERFLPGNPGWHLTGVDPSRNMLALAEAKVDRLGLQDRATLIQGTVQDLPAGADFDAAVCMLVLHFLPDDGKLALLQGIASRLRPDAPLLVAAGGRLDDGGLNDDILRAWQVYGELMGMPAGQMADMMARLAAQPNGATGEVYVRLLRAAGFKRVTSFFSAMAGGVSAWLAR
jgi:tRNA (cmo5U34)-methyltransferase